MNTDEIIDSHISSLLSLSIGNHGPCQNQLISMINKSTYDSKFGMAIGETSIKRPYNYYDNLFKPDSTHYGHASSLLG